MDSAAVSTVATRCPLLLLALGALTCAAASKPSGNAQPGHPQGMAPDKALNMLLEGNQRYVTHKEQHPGATPERRHELVKGQHPFAVIVGCADSRVPPELVFDLGFGDLFVIREAGNVLDNIVLGSVEYAVEHLGVRLVMVLGHEQCGAVTAAVKHANEAHISSIIRAIQPAVKETKDAPGDAVHNCVIANARQVAARIRAAKPIVSKLVIEGAVKVVAAVYDLDSGEVKILE